MKAIEFNTELKNDSIKIPKEYLSSLLGYNKLKVILLYDEDEAEEGMVF